MEWWRFIRNVLWAAGLLLAFFAAVEIFRVLVFFYRLHPAAGMAFLAVSVLLLFVVVFRVGWALRRIPRVLEAPDVPEPLEDASTAEVRRYARYLARYIHRLRHNPGVSGTLKKETAADRHAFEDLARRNTSKDQLLPAVRRMETNVVAPMLAALREQAEKEVRGSVRDVMLGVTLSPYHSLDLLIVLYRNIGMILRVTRLYASRPLPREQWKIVWDVAKVLATVNFFHMGRKLFDGLFANLPLIGRAADDIGQGLGAGLFTSAAGHAAMLRCEAYRGWEKREAAETLLSRTGRFFADVRDLFLKDVLPETQTRILAVAERTGESADSLLDRIKESVNESVQRVVDTVDTCLVQPVGAGSQYLARAGAKAVGHNRRGRSARHRRGLGGALFERIKYTFLGSRIDRS